MFFAYIKYKKEEKKPAIGLTPLSLSKQNDKMNGNSNVASTTFEDSIEALFIGLNQPNNGIENVNGKSKNKILNSDEGQMDNNGVRYISTNARMPMSESDNDNNSVNDNNNNNNTSLINMNRGHKNKY